MLRTDPITTQPVLLHPEGILHLNASAHAIVLRCNGNKTVAEILGELSEEYEVAETQFQQEVVQCLAALHERQHVEFLP